MTFPDFATAMSSRGGDLYWETYDVVTKDGYKLRLFRILGAKGLDGSKQHKGPLLLVHGATTDSIAWFRQNDKEAAAMGTQLFEAGYDVWFANMRGSRYSREHVRFDADIDSRQYWNFNLKQIGLEDISAIVEKITKTSKTCKKITLMGHSLGTNNIVYSLVEAKGAEKYID